MRARLARDLSGLSTPFASHPAHFATAATSSYQTLRARPCRPVEPHDAPARCPCRCHQRGRCSSPEPESCRSQPSFAHAMKVTVSRDGVAIGVWERADIKAAVATGELQPTDRYFAKGMASWLPLSSLTHAIFTPKRASQSIPSLSPVTSWKRAATTAGCALVFLAGFSAIIHPSFLTQALVAAAGFLLIAAARTLP